MTDLLQTPRPFGGFATIYADPPWAFLTRTGSQRLPQQVSAKSGIHYPSMSHRELQLLPVRRMAARDCALIMWIVDSHLLEGLELGAHWGFTFKTKLFTWRKTTQAGDKGIMGMGYWSRKETEQAYLFTRGAPARLDAGVGEVVEAPRREHSRKPDEFYDRIERLVGGPYLELFARQRRQGWTAWGNQVGLFDAGEVAA